MMRHRDGEGTETARAAGRRPLNLIGEFIGKRLVVVGSSCAGLRGIKGKVVDETKNTFLLETERGEKRVPKIPCVFEIGGREVAGKEIAFRAEDRPRKIGKKIRK